MGEEIDGAMQQAAQPGRQVRGGCEGLSGRLMKAIRLREEAWIVAAVAGACAPGRGERTAVSLSAVRGTSGEKGPCFRFWVTTATADQCRAVRPQTPAPWR